MPATPPPRWFQFRLRTLLIAVAVLAVPLAWVGHSLNWVRQRHAVIHSERFGKIVMMAEYPGTRPVGAPNFLWLLGEEGVNGVAIENDSSDNFAELQRLFPEAEITTLFYPKTEKGTRK